MKRFTSMNLSSLQAGSPYGLFRDLLSNSLGGVRPIAIRKQISEQPIRRACLQARICEFTETGAVTQPKLEPHIKSQTSKEIKIHRTI